MNKITLIFVFIVFSSFGLVFGQNNWSPGFVISLKGDTLHGSIFYNEVGTDASLCKFKKDSKAEEEMFSSSELVGYRFEDGKFFVSKNIKEINPDAPVFVEFLISGKVNIYRYNANGDRLFAEKDAVIKELKNSQQKQQVDFVDKIVSKKEYRGVLNFFFKDANMSSEIANSKLQPKSIIKLAKTYHETVCTDEQCIIYERQVKPLHVSFGFITGLTYNSFAFQSFFSDYSPGYQVGCRLEIFNILEMIERVYFSVDVDLQKYNTYNIKILQHNVGEISYKGRVHHMERFDFSNNGDTNARNGLNVDLDVLALQIPLSVNYLFSTHRVQPYIGSGILNAFVLSQNSEVIVSDFYSVYYLEVPKFQYGFHGNAGCKFILKNKCTFFIEGCFDYSSITDFYTHLSKSNTSFALKCGYSF